ncbi:MAG: molybdopterin-dependent oxidoreductase [Armatimonadetes bacterium]|nr:molybdopterin-dependent oxidoreductase [Armatimonadota bacterium]
MTPINNKPKRFTTFQKPSVRPVDTAPVPRLTPRETWEREEAKPAIKASATDEARIRQLSRRSFLWVGIASVATVGGLWAFNRDPEEGKSAGGAFVPRIEGTKAPLRKVLSFNEFVARNLFYSPTNRAQEFPRSMAIEPRNNYHGATPEIDLADWTLTLEGAKGRDKPLVLTLADIQTLPEVSQTTELKCIEGWSAITNWSGVRLHDFLQKYPPPDGTRYLAMYSEPVGQEDTWYNVGLDIESAMHPQSILATAMNDEALTSEHGAPLRLIMPHKYGIKSIKLITRIAYSDTRPGDYWYEQGYDWYAGL